MPHAIAHLNWFSIPVAVIACFILGGIWFPLIVKRAYIRALDCEMKTGTLSLVGPLACLTTTTVTSAILIGLLGIESYAEAACFGLLVGIGYLTPMVVNISINPLFPRPFLYSAINAPYFIGSSVLVSLIIFAMS